MSTSTPATPTAPAAAPFKLQIYRPVETNKLTQHFGDNQACAKVYPTGAPYRPYQILDKLPNGTCPAGSVDFYKLINMKGHNGQDQAAWHGEPGYHSALFPGWLLSAHDQDNGLNVMVVSNEPLVPCTAGCAAGTIHYILMIYAHGSSMVGYDKKPVNPGDNIMLCDNTGDSSGDHCHFAPKWCDKDGVQLHQDNGYAGAFSPAPDYTNEFILDYLNAQKALPVAIQHPAVAALPAAPAPAPISTLDQMTKALFQAKLFLQGFMHTSTSTPAQ